jgi:hypothetical protein
LQGAFDMIFYQAQAIQIFESTLDNTTNTAVSFFCCL